MQMGYRDEHLSYAREKPVLSVSHFGKKLRQRQKRPAVTPLHFRINVILMDMLRCQRKMLLCSGT